MQKRSTKIRHLLWHEILQHSVFEMWSNLSYAVGPPPLPINFWTIFLGNKSNLRRQFRQSILVGMIFATYSINMWHRRHAKAGARSNCSSTDMWRRMPTKRIKMPTTSPKTLISFLKSCAINEYVNKVYLSSKSNLAHVLWGNLWRLLALFALALRGSLAFGPLIFDLSRFLKCYGR